MRCAALLRERVSEVSIELWPVRTSERVEHARDTAIVEFGRALDCAREAPGQAAAASAFERAASLLANAAGLSPTPDLAASLQRRRGHALCSSRCSQRRGCLCRVRPSGRASPWPGITQRCSCAASGLLVFT